MSTKTKAARNDPDGVEHLARGHTPGPWRVTHDGFAVSAAPNGILAIIDNMAVKMNGRQQAIANARLIAAAPTLLAYVVKRAEAGDAEAIAILGAVNGNS